MRTIISFAALIAVGFAIPTIDQDKDWREYKAAYGKVYDPQEELMRKEIFLWNKASVDDHNALFAAGLRTYEKAVNHLSDWTQEEKRTKSKGLILPKERRNVEFHELSGESLPDHIDWRDKGAVTPVKNQGPCGSCYAFSATGALEGQYAIKLNKTVSLSEQEIVDCRFSECFGCSGGWPDSIYQDIAKGGPSGLESEQEYPYTGKEGVCQLNRTEEVATDKGYKQVKEGSEEALKDAVATIGPMSVSIAATDNFDLYKSGIFHDDSCTPSTIMNHAVLIVGYGEEKGQAYWIVKNSWGHHWGEKGYIRMARNAKNMCRIADVAVSPIL